MALETLAFNDVLNNDIAHFFKSGNIRRSEKNKQLDIIHHLLPEKGNHGTNLEYDIWYEFKNEPKIRGYVYTDVMTKFVYLKPASYMYCKKILRSSLEKEITEEGENIFNDIANNNTDKYNLQTTDIEYPFVIFLAGTNILEEITDDVKVLKAVKERGAKLKPHPLTSPFGLSFLKAQYGKDCLIPKNLSGHTVLNKARTVGCTSNSEMGLVALTKGKRVELFDRKNVVPKTYTAIYTVLFENGYPIIEDFKRMLSSEDSGLISYLSKDPEKNINNFFKYFKRVLHVRPKRPKSLDTRK